MNKIYKCIILLILLFFMTLIIYLCLKDNCINGVAYKNVEKENEQYNYTIYSNTDYIATKPNDIYKYADLVIVGNYKQTNRNYIGNIQAVVTESKFSVKDVLKGTYDKNEIIINYYGGTVSLEEYVKSLSEQQIEKRGLNLLNERQIKQGTVSYDVGRTKVDINNRNDDYLIFLSYDKESDIYFVLADGYGMRKLSDDNKIFDLDMNSYDININELNKM